MARTGAAALEHGGRHGVARRVDQREQPAEREAVDEARGFCVLLGARQLRHRGGRHDLERVPDDALQSFFTTSVVLRVCKVGQDGIGKDLVGETWERDL